MHFLTLLGDPITTLIPGLFTSRPVADDSGSEACFKIAQYWLKTCLETHNGLCQVKEKMPLPTRVLDVGLLDSHLVNLYISNGEYGQWLTLSHCWGESHPATTTTSNLDSHCNRISISTLPRTFQDAIIITRKLGYRYLWIDSLCIVQDSMLDWQQESVKMNTIYANAVLNISADAAADSSEGIFASSNLKQDRKMSMIPPPRPDYTHIPVHSPKTGLKSTLHASFWHYDGFSDDDPLKRRGWVLAETVLSHRRLRYTPSGLAWSCARVPSYCEESRPHEIHDITEQDQYITSVYQIPHERLPPRHVFERGNDARRWQIVQWWYRRINDYINRQLTFPHDKFPAFSGIAKTYSERTQYSYKAGLLIEDFRRGLLWQTCGRPVDLAVAPSWSWAVVGYREVPHDIYELFYAHETYVDDPDEVELIDICVRNMGDNAFGQVVSGSLTLRGLGHGLKELLKTIEFYFLWSFHEFGFSSYFRDRDYQLLDRDASPPRDALRLHLDVMNDSCSAFSQREDVHLLRIGVFSSHASLGLEDHLHEEATSYLILQKIPGLEAAYRRIGVARILGNGVESPDWKMKTVTIL